MFFEVKMQEEVRCRWSNNKLNCKKQQKQRIWKKTNNKVLANIFRSFEVENKVELMSWIAKNTMKRKCSVFSCYKHKDKVCLVYLE